MAPDPKSKGERVYSLDIRFSKCMNPSADFTQYLPAPVPACAFLRPLGAIHQCAAS